MLHFTILGSGTSTGVPLIGCDCEVCKSADPINQRLRTSIKIQSATTTVVIDTTPDFRYQMLRANCHKIDALIFTHEHADHVAGFDDIRPYCFRQGALPIYAHNRVINSMHERFAYVFETKNRYPGAPSVKTIVVKNEPFILNNVTVTPINAYHNKLQVFGYRFHNFAYLTDVKTIEIEEINKLKNLEVIVVSALRIEPHHSHFNLEEALALIATVKPKKAYLTHISHALGFHDDVEKTLPQNVYLAYDNLQIEIKPKDYEK